MAKKKDTTGVCEYFKTTDIHICGHFKDYVDAMWTQNAIQQSHVKRLVDLYAIAAIVGLRKGIRLPDDSSSEKRTIQMQQLNESYQTLGTIMKLVLMMDESRGLDEEERIRSAFKVPENRQEHDAGMELFNSYARGGIEYLYEQLVTRVNVDITEEDFGDPKINNIVAFLKNMTGNQPEEI